MGMIMTIMSRVLLLLLLVSLSATNAYAQSEESNGDREYLFYKPSSLPEGTSAPLLVVLHGAYGDADFMKNALKIQSSADKGGFMVAYLNGTKIRLLPGRVWNAGKCCGRASRENIDDTGFIDGVIQSLVQEKGADPTRVYVMGHSNGAMMTLRYVCEKASTIKGAVIVSGALVTDTCQNARGVKVLHIHGDKDGHVPSQGGFPKESNKDMNYRSVNQTKAAVEKAGATYEVRILAGVGHKIAEIDKELQRQDGLTLGETVAKFMSTVK